MSIRDELVAAPRVPLRYLVRMNPRPPGLNASESCYLPMEAISEFGPADSSRLRPTSELAQGYSYIADGDVAYAKVTPCFENGKGLRAANLPGGYAFATTEITVMRPGKDLDSRYLAWLLQSEDFRATGESRMSGAGGLKRVPESYAASYRVPHPRPEVQRAIADYLDRETSQIDAFIAKNEELIALLTERLGAVVDGVMAELGFAEPGDLAISREYPLPESWRIISLGSLLLQLTNGYVGPTRDILVDDGIRYIQGTHIKKGKIDFLRRPFYVTRKWHDERPRIHLREGDVLIVQTGDIGKVAVVPSDFGEASCHALQIARVNRRIIDPQFLGAYLSSRFGYHQLTSRATGALHLHLEASIKSAPVVVPPLHVQAQIVREVRERESQIETAIGTAERLIAFSEERRAALISAAVTGKIDVRMAV